MTDSRQLVPYHTLAPMMEAVRTGSDAGAVGQDTGGAYAMLEILVSPQSGPPSHLHSREVESFYILEGSLSFWLADQKLSAGAGCLVIAPPGLPHAFKNEGDTPARALLLITPAGLEEFFEEALSLQRLIEHPS